MAGLNNMDNIGGAETRKFASHQADQLVGRLAFEVGRAARTRTSDAVHDLWVATRRLRQLLRVFKPAFRGKELRKIRRELKRIMLAAGEVRNCDVSLKLLSKSKEAERIKLRPKLQSRRRESERSLRLILASWLERKSSRKWRSQLENCEADADQLFSRALIEATARKTLPAMAAEFFELGNRAGHTKASPKELQRFFNASGKFRYSLELFAPLYAPSLGPALEKIKTTQRMFGDIHDCETVRTMIADYKGSAGIIAWLSKRQRKKIREFQAYWSESLGTESAILSWTDLLSHPAKDGLPVRKPAAGTRAASTRVGRRPTAVA